MIFASACVGLHRLPGEPVAFGEDFIDFVSLLPPVAGRRPGRSGDLNFGLFCLPPHPPAGHTPGLAGQIIEGQLEGLEPAGKAFGIDQAIGRRRREQAGAGPQGVDRESCRRKGCAADTSRILRGVGSAPGKICAYRRAGRRDWKARCPFRYVPLRHGTRGRHLHHQPPGRNDNEAPHGGFGGPQHTQHGAVEGVRNPRHCLPSSPSMANRAAMMPFSASLLSLMAPSQSKSLCQFILRIPVKNITGTYEPTRNTLSRVFIHIAGKWPLTLPLLAQWAPPSPQ